MVQSKEEKQAKQNQRKRLKTQLAKEHPILKQQLAETTQQLEETQQQLVDTQDQLEETQHQLEETQQKLDTAEHKVTELESTSTFKAHLRCQLLETENKLLKSELEDLQAPLQVKIDKRRRQYRKSKQKIRSVMNQNTNSHGAKAPPPFSSGNSYDGNNNMRSNNMPVDGNAQQPHISLQELPQEIQAALVAHVSNETNRYEDSFRQQSNNQAAAFQVQSQAQSQVSLEHEQNRRLALQQTQNLIQAFGSPVMPRQSRGRSRSARSTSSTSRRRRTTTARSDSNQEPPVASPSTSTTLSPAEAAVVRSNPNRASLAASTSTTTTAALTTLVSNQSNTVGGSRGGLAAPAVTAVVPHQSSTSGGGSSAVSRRRKRTEGEDSEQRRSKRARRSQEPVLRLAAEASSSDTSDDDDEEEANEDDEHVKKVDECHDFFEEFLKGVPDDDDKEVAEDRICGGCGTLIPHDRSTCPGEDCKWMDKTVGEPTSALQAIVEAQRGMVPCEKCGQKKKLNDLCGCQALFCTHCKKLFHKDLLTCPICGTGKEEEDKKMPAKPGGGGFGGSSAGGQITSNGFVFGN